MDDPPLGQAALLVSAPMPGPHPGGLADGAPLSGKLVLGGGARGHKSTPAMLHGLATMRRAGHESQVHG
ncbi:MAG: hypothetical protein FWD12_12070 [Alphaproteobacteria bacterium]|nr:hypothetical protein [Alphaproteobacteria bacterium]